MSNLTESPELIVPTPALYATWDWERNLTEWADHYSDQAKYEQQLIMDAKQSILGRIFHFFHPIYWDYVHRECLELNGTYKEFTNYPLGAAYLASGIIYEAIYIPVLVIMLSKEFIQHACYKIMFVMGVMDCVSLIPNAILAGYYLFVGGSICTYPLLNVWLGFLAFALWCGYCTMAILLGLNRTLDFGWPRLAESLFSGWRVYLWIFGGPVAFVIWIVLTNVPSQFNPILAGYFFDINIFKPMTANTVHMVNNLGVTTCAFVLNVIMVSFLVRLYNKSSVGVSTMQKVVVIQCLSICLVMMTASGIYCFMQFIPVPMFFVVFSTMLWQFSNGAPGIMYIVVNRSIRNAFLTMIGLKKEKSAHQPSTASTAKVAPVSKKEKDSDAESKIEDKF